MPLSQHKTEPALHRKHHNTEYTAQPLNTTQKKHNPSPTNTQTKLKKA